MKTFDFSFIYNVLMVLSLLFSFLVISSKNPMHSIVFLICVFINIFLILFLQELEFLSIIFLIIYVGAVAILFLFVIYMLNIRVIELRDFNFFYLVGILISFFLLAIYCFIFYMPNFFFIFKDVFFYKNFYSINWLNFLYDFDNLSIISFYLYNDLGIVVIIVGLVLLVAVVGSVVLNLNYSFYKYEQNIFKQIKRRVK